MNLNHFFKFSKNSIFFDFVNAYGDKFLSLPALPRDAEVAEYINLILFSKQNLKTAFEPIELDLMQSLNFKKL